VLRCVLKKVRPTGLLLFLNQQVFCCFWTNRSSVVFEPTGPLFFWTNGSVVKEN